jgi:hypothetical protein
MTRVTQHFTTVLTQRSPNFFLNNISTDFSYQKENKGTSITNSNVTKTNSTNITSLYETKADIITANTDKLLSIMATKRTTVFHSFHAFK